VTSHGVSSGGNGIGGNGGIQSPTAPTAGDINTGSGSGGGAGHGLGKNGGSGIVVIRYVTPT
jgi:hypothetical protein